MAYTTVRAQKQNTTSRQIVPSRSSNTSRENTSRNVQRVYYTKNTLKTHSYDGKIYVVVQLVNNSYRRLKDPITRKYILYKDAFILQDNPKDLLNDSIPGQVYDYNTLYKFYVIDRKYTIPGFMPPPIIDQSTLLKLQAELEKYKTNDKIAKLLKGAGFRL